MFTLILALVAAVPLPCRLARADSAWLARALDGWQAQNQRALGVTIRQPALVLFDAKCVHRLTPVVDRVAPARFIAAKQPFAVRSSAHQGRVRLPDGAMIPAGLTSFAGPLPAGRMFFVMSLPSVWRARDLDPGGGDRLATAVFLHEYTHTQSPALGTLVDSLTRRGLPVDVNDDVIQQRFGARPDFRTSYEAERDLLFEAAADPSDSQARALAARALERIDQRRARTFVGADSIYAELEDVFLTMEGLGQWVAYRWLTDGAGGAMAAPDALSFIRRGGRHWSQDEGFALLLITTRLSPSSPRAMLATPPVTVLRALRRSLTSR